MPTINFLYDIRNGHNFPQALRGRTYSTPPPDCPNSPIPPVFRIPHAPKQLTRIAAALLYFADLPTPPGFLLFVLLFWPFGMPPFSSAHFLLGSYINKWHAFPRRKVCSHSFLREFPLQSIYFFWRFLCPKIHPGTARPCVTSLLPMVTAARSRSLLTTWAFVISTQEICGSQRLRNRCPRNQLFPREGHRHRLRPQRCFQRCVRRHRAGCHQAQDRFYSYLSRPSHAPDPATRKEEYLETFEADWPDLVYDANTFNMSDSDEESDEESDDTDSKPGDEPDDESGDESEAESPAAHHRFPLPPRHRPTPPPSCHITFPCDYCHRTPSCRCDNSPWGGCRSAELLP